MRFEGKSMNNIQEILVSNYKNNIEKITVDQIGMQSYEKLVELELLIYKGLSFAYNNVGKLSKKEYADSKKQVLEKLRILEALIGNVNEHELGLEQKARNCYEQLIGYAILSYDEKNPTYNRFRARFEAFLARTIIMQNDMISKLFDDEKADKEISQTVKNRIAKRTDAKKESGSNGKNTNTINPATPTRVTKPIPQKKIMFTDKLYIRSDSGFVPADAEYVRAKVSVLDRAGRENTIEKILMYHAKTGRYYVTNDAFVALKQNGVVLCQVISVNTEGGNTNSTAKYSRLKIESKLHQSGYSVNSNDDLTDIQRQCILDKVLENKLYTYGELANHLEWLISRNGNSRKDMFQAVTKWEKDRNYVINKYLSQR